MKSIRKRKVDHMEGEFKKIEPTSFDRESKIGEEVQNPGCWISKNISKSTTTLET